MKSFVILLGIGLVGLSLAAQGQIVVQGEAPKPEPSTPPEVVPLPKGTEKQQPDMLKFINGDVLHGEFVSMDAKSGARWQHPAIKEPMEIDLASIALIKLEHGAAEAKANAEQNCKVRLVNGDLLCGKLVGMDDTALELNTWYGGTLKIPRKSIELIVPGQAKSVLVYEGPTGMEGWTKRGGGGMMVGPGGIVTRIGENWTYNDGSFVSSGSGSIGRAFEIPAMANIEFDLAWTGYLQLSLSLLSDSLEQYGGNCYMLMLSQGNVYLQRTSRAGDSAMLGTAEATALTRKNQAHISVRINREQKSISLLVDGGLVKQWTDPAAFMNGQNLVFNQQGQFRTKLSHLKIAPWDGRLEENTGGEKKTEEDLVKLSNKDKISGTLKSIQNGKMSFQTSFAALEVPIDRVTEIDMAGQKTEQPAPKPGEVRLEFADGGAVTVQVEHWDAQQIKASSPTLGEVKFKPSAFAEVVMNSGDKKTEQGETSMGGLGDDIIIDKN